MATKRRWCSWGGLPFLKNNNLTNWTTCRTCGKQCGMPPLMGLARGSGPSSTLSASGRMNSTSSPLGCFQLVMQPPKSVTSALEPHACFSTTVGSPPRPATTSTRPGMPNSSLSAAMSAEADARGAVRKRSARRAGRGAAGRAANGLRAVGALHEKWGKQP